MNIPKIDIITGDRVELLCDYRFNISNFLADNPAYSGTQQDLVDIQIDEINRQASKVIFVYGHDTPLFLQNINKIRSPFKLVTHNSDLGIFEHYKPLITDKIIQWYGQNNYISHDKVFALPIAIARARWPHGNLDLLTTIADCNYQKGNLVYKNFDIGTNLQVRQHVHKITQNNGIFMDNHTSIPTYWEKVAKSLFIISPSGNGVDCHRIWESLYLGSVPVVENHQALHQFRDLPILFVNDWNDVKFSFLEKHLNIYEKFKDSEMLKMLKLSYWRNKIG